MKDAIEDGRFSAGCGLWSSLEVSGLGSASVFLQEDQAGHRADLTDSSLVRLPLADITSMSRGASVRPRSWDIP